MSIHDRALIREIQAKPALWDRNNPYYRNKVCFHQWQEIAFHLNADVNTVKKRWRTLRNKFRKEVSKCPEKRSWPYYQDMQFLEGQLKNLPLPGTTRPKTKGKEKENGKAPVNNQQKSVGGIGAFPKGSNKGAAADNNDDDYHFLMSLRSEMKKLQPKKKLQLRTKMMQLLNKEAN